MDQPSPAPDPSSRSDERRRRRTLYGPPPRLTETSPLVGRLVWHIGDWGRASEHIGARWEALAPALLRKSLDAAHLLLVLAQVPERMAEVLGSGLSHADALRVWREEDALLLEPLDFKWSLETASRKQVSVETLQHLLEVRLTRLEEALATLKASLALPQQAEIVVRTGRFVAPEHPSNRAALETDPGLPSVLLGVDAQELFRPLPGWPVAEVLARMEGKDLDGLSRIDQVERYYRLGAGVAGALTKIHTPVFHAPPSTVDVVRLLEQRERRGSRAVNRLLLEVEAALKERRLREEQLTSLARRSYPFGQARTDLTRAHLPRRLLESRGTLGRLYGEIIRTLEETICEEGRVLVAAGVSEDEALAHLANQETRWRQAGQERILRLAEQLIRSDSAPPPER